MSDDAEITAAAAALGRRGGSKPKNFSTAELARRTERLKAARVARWAGHKKKKAVKR